MTEYNGKPNRLLRQQRELRGWSQARVAEHLQKLGGVADSKLVGKWERGVVRPSPFYRERLCNIYGVTADQLGLVYNPSQHAQEIETAAENAKVLQPLAHTMNNEFMRMEDEGITMEHSRRSFLQLLGGMGISLTVPANIPLPSTNSCIETSNNTLESIAIITQNYRTLQKSGFTLENNLQSHISLIQHALENTSSERYRRELWRNLALTQLLARHNITHKKTECMRARTWNEAAIASAQYSGDALLLGAALGHLGHLYFCWLDDPKEASRLINQAQIYLKGHPVNGWLAMVIASITAQTGEYKQCKTSIDKALEIAHNISKNPENADPYYTDFNVVGTQAFAGNCFLKIGEPEKALEHLLTMDLEKLSKNRHASAFYDITRAYTLQGDLEKAQAYAIQSIDTAITTNRTYIINRMVDFLHGSQQKYHHTSHTSFILEYAQHALVTKGGIA